MLQTTYFEKIKSDLFSGMPILVFDSKDREAEVDMVFYGGTISWKSIYTLRKYAGGLICYVTGLEEGQILGLGFITEQWRKNEYNPLVKRPSYGDEPAFSTWVNHISVKTGISDQDRATTIIRLHEVVTETHNNPRGARERFVNEFMGPGHVPILLSRGIEKRKGHTELVTRLADTLGLERSMVIAEMLGEDGKSLSLQDAKEFAYTHSLILVEGKELF